MSEPSDTGKPLEYFLIDPPIVIDPDALGLSPVGQTLIERDGVTHVIDWIGSTHYPNVADFVEEAKRYGTSRRASKALDFSRLTGESKIIFVHARAHIAFHDLYQKQRIREVYVGGFDSDGIEHGEYRPWCPKHLDEHMEQSYTGMCAGLWWEDLDGPTRPTENELRTRALIRNGPSFSYSAFFRPPNIQSRYSPAMFLALPLTSIHIIAAADWEHEVAFSKATASALPVLVRPE